MISPRLMKKMHRHLNLKITWADYGFSPVFETRPLRKIRVFSKIVAGLRPYKIFPGLISAIFFSKC
jgi:hypothetical protein